MPAIPLRALSPRSARPSVLPSDSYATDGRRLFRVVSGFDPSVQYAFASLEDCMTLEVRPYAPGELTALALRPVQPRWQL